MDLGSGVDATELNAAELAAACPWPPDFVITYPLDGSRLSWQHWTEEGDLHPNSADWVTGSPIKLVHTAAKDQTKAGGRLVERIRQLGGTCEESTITLPEIPDAVNPGAGEEPSVHVYVGDMIQIQRMSRNPGGYPIDLDVNLYTDQYDIITPLFLAPFGRKNS